VSRQTHYRTCNLCEALCGLAIEHDGRRVLSIRGDEQDPFSRGHICPKAVALQDVHEDPDRLRAPQRRRGDGWDQVAWDPALDDCATRIADIQDRFGPSAVAFYVGNPTVHNLGALLFAAGFMKTLGTRNRFSATSVDQLPHMLASLLMFGHQALLPVPDVDRTDYILMLGANPIVSNGSLMSAPDIKGRLRALRRRGGKLVLLDPRRTETAAMADEHHFIRPGSDALFLAALVHTLYADDLIAVGRLGAFTEGVKRMGSLVKPFTPEVVASATGIAAEDTRRVARELAAADRAVCYGRIGICVQQFGGLSAWLVNAINLLTGNLDRAGGSMFTKPAVDIVAGADAIGMRGHFDKGRSRVRGLPEFGGEYPVVTLAEEITTEGEGKIRALITLAGNPVLSTPNGKQLARALEKLDFMVSVDLNRNETTRFADYILPPTSQLEQSHYDLALNALAVRNVAKYSPPLFEPPPDAKDDWQIHVELATRIEQKRSLGKRIAGRVMREALLRIRPEGLLDGMLRFGPYGTRTAGIARGALGRDGGMSLAELRRHPHGVDLGPLAPCLPERLYTTNKRIELVPECLASDVVRLEAWLEVAPGEGALLLIGRRQLRTNNSWIHNSLRMVRGAERCTLLMHPEDARARQIDGAARVRIRSRVGEIEAPLQLSESMMRGVVSLPHGFGHDQDGVKLTIATKYAGVSINDITDEHRIDPLSGTAQLNGLPVEVLPVPG